MGTYRRINVASGRQLEQLAHYSRALRVGDMVLQSGSTAIDRDGNVIGEGDIAAQVDAIVRLAEWSMGKAGGKLDDVVRSRIYVTDISLADQAARALAKYFRDVRPAATLVQVNRLARPTQLIEIEFEAIDGAKDTAQRVSSGRLIEEEYAYSRAVRVDDRVFVSGSTALNPDGVVVSPGDMYGQTRATIDTICWALDQVGATPGDILNTKSFVTDIAAYEAFSRARREALPTLYPAATLLGIPALVTPEMLVEIEVDAHIGAATTRQEVFSPRHGEQTRGYARAVVAGDWVYVSGTTSLNAAGEVEAAGDWAGQFDICMETIQWALEQAGASLDDVIRKRTFTVDRAEQNRPYGEGPAWFANSCPTSLGCRVSGLVHPALLVELEAVALKGAHADIEWIGPDAVDPLGT